MVDEYLKQQQARKNKPYYGIIGKLISFKDKKSDAEVPAMITKVNEDTGMANLYLLQAGEVVQTTVHRGDDGDEMVVTDTKGINSNREVIGVPNKGSELDTGEWWWTA